MTRRFLQVDVFGSGPFTGNPVAVVRDAEGLTDHDMSRISAWTNLSECTFVLAPTTPEADYRVRIFSLATELPFAGHPTLGTARAWLETGGAPRDAGVIVQECAAGLIRVRRDGDDLAFAAPPTVHGGAVDGDLLAEVADVLGIRVSDVVDAQWVDNGPGWVAVLLESADAVLALRPALGARTGAWFVGAVGPRDDDALEVRAFFTEGGPLAEDPVTGSLNASLAQWLTATGRVSAPYTARQGTAIGRAGRVRVSADGDDLWIGGTAHVAVRGELEA